MENGQIFSPPSGIAQKEREESKKKVNRVDRVERGEREYREDRKDREEREDREEKEEREEGVERDEREEREERLKKENELDCFIAVFEIVCDFASKKKENRAIFNNELVSILFYMMNFFDQVF